MGTYFNVNKTIFYKKKKKNRKITQYFLDNF